MTYHEEKPKGCLIINEWDTVNNDPCAPHDFRPQANFIFHHNNELSIESNVNGIVYLIHEGQQVVIE